MDRLYTMARFEEPKDPKCIGTCDNCGSELYEGQDVYSSSDGTFCEEECALDYYGVHKKVLEKEEPYYD